MRRFGGRQRPSCLLQAVRQRCLRPLRRGAVLCNADYYVKKYPSAEFALALTAHFLMGGGSLRSLERRLCEDRLFGKLTGLANISKAQLPKLLHERPAELWQPLIEDLLGRLPRRKLPPELRILDSTCFALGNRLLSRQVGRRLAPECAGAKVCILLQAETHAPLSCQVHLGGGSDTNMWPKLLEADPPGPDKLYLFDRGFRSYKVYDELITAQAHFLTRAWDKQMHFTVLEQLPLKPESPEIISDQRVLLGCHCRYRMEHSVRYFVLQTPKGPVGFISSDFDRPAAELAELYRSRWQIEVFFRWLKSTLGCVRPLGYSERAAQHTIYAALVAYLLILLLAQSDLQNGPRGALRGVTAAAQSIRHRLLAPVDKAMPTALTKYDRLL